MVSKYCSFLPIYVFKRVLGSELVIKFASEIIYLRKIRVYVR